MKPRQASSNATLLVSMMMNICLRLMERLANRRIGLAGLVSNDSGQIQHARVNCQLRSARRIHIDDKPDSVLLLVQTDDSAARFGKSIAFPHGEGVAARERLGDLRPAFLFGFSDKQNVAAGNFLE